MEVLTVAGTCDAEKSSAALYQYLIHYNRVCKQAFVTRNICGERRYPGVKEQAAAQSETTLAVKGAQVCVAALPYF